MIIKQSTLSFNYTIGIKGKCIIDRNEVIRKVRQYLYDNYHMCRISNKHIAGVLKRIVWSALDKTIKPENIIIGVHKC